jgi:hypothetical protein
VQDFAQKPEQDDGNPADDVQGFAEEPPKTKEDNQAKEK